MRFKGRKWASPFFIISLAVAGLFGVTAGVIDRQAKDNQNSEKAEAASNWSKGDTIYFRLYKGYEDAGCGPYINYCWDSANNKWDGGVPTKKTLVGVDNTYYYYEYTFTNTPVTTQNLQLQRKYNGGSGGWQSQEEFGASHSYNLISLDGYDNDLYYPGANLCDYYLKSATGGTISATATDHGSITLDSHNYIYDDWSISLTGTASSNYSFTYWTQSTSVDGTYVKRDDCGGTPTSRTDTITGLSGKVFHSALFTANSYTITYKDRGDVAYSGSNAGSLPGSRNYGTDLTLVDGVKSGYIFYGWFEKSDCSGSKITSISGTTVGNKTLYAKFVKRPVFASGFVIVGNSTFNQSAGIGGSASDYEWEYFTENQEMTGTKVGDQQAGLQHVKLASGSQFKHAYYNGTTVSNVWDNTALVDTDSSWSGTYLTAGDSTNAQVKAAGNDLYYDFFVGNNNKLYVTPSHLDVHMKGVFIRGDTTVIEPSDLTPASSAYGVALYKQTYTAPTSSWSYNYSNVTYTFTGWYTSSELTTPYVSTADVTSDIIIYAKFEDLNNYVTYNHNDNSGTSPVLIDPSHIDTTHIVRDYDDLHWSDAFFRSFTEWNTESNGSGTRYNPDDTFKITGATTLYAQQDWHEVFISIDNGRTWNTTSKSAETPASTQRQYETDSKLIVDSDYARIKIKYRNVNTGVETILDNSDIAFEGYNYNSETGGVNVSFTDNIFLKVKNDNSLQCYIPGATQRTLIIKHAAGGETSVAMYKDTDTQWKSGDHEVYVRKGDKIWVKFETGVAYKSWCMAATYDGFERDTTDDGVAKCTTTGAYTIYLQKGDPEKWKDIVVGTRDETKSAAYFARMFNHEMSAICDNYDTNTAASFIDAWQENATENAVAVFGELSSTCQAGLKTDTYDSNSDVAAFKVKYDYILGKYGYGLGDDDLRDFLGRTPVRLPIGSISSLAFDNDEDKMSYTIIIIASSISLLSITALSVLMVKKRKRKEY